MKTDIPTNALEARFELLRVRREPLSEMGNLDSLRSQTGDIRKIATIKYKRRTYTDRSLNTVNTLTNPLKDS